MILLFACNKFYGGDNPNGVHSASFRKGKAKAVNVRSVCGVKNTHFLKGWGNEMVKWL